MGKPNKSEVIREYLLKHPNAKPTELAQLIAKEHPRLGVTSQYVSNIKTNMGGSSKPARRQVRRVARKDNDMQYIDALVALKQATQVIGAEGVKRLVDEGVLA